MYPSVCLLFFFFLIIVYWDYVLTETWQCFFRSSKKLVGVLDECLLVLINMSWPNHRSWVVLNAAEPLMLSYLQVCVCVCVSLTHRLLSSWVFTIQMKFIQIDLFFYYQVCTCVTSTPLFTGITGMSLVFFSLLRWAGQGAEENLHKVGQQASHQGLCHRVQKLFEFVLGFSEVFFKVKDMLLFSNM